MDIPTLVDRARRLSADMAALADDLATLERATPPPPIVLAPPWPPDTIDRSDARSTGTGQQIDVILSPDQGGRRASSVLHEKHLDLPRALRRIEWSADVRIDSAMIDARTWKFGGVAAFNGDWAQWPGAGAWGPTNAMSRLTGWHYDRQAGTERLATYITFPAAVGVANKTNRVGGAVAYVSTNQRTAEFLLPVRPAPDVWFNVAHRIDVDAGTHTTIVNGETVLELTGLPWPDAGFNRVYVSAMIGGEGPDFLPRTPDRTGRLSYRRFTVTPWER